MYNAPEARRFDADYGTDGDRPPIDERRVLLSDVFDRVKKTITYEYDFGDAWVHAVRLECVVRRESVVLPGGAVVGPERAAVCVAGERNCPPEDCGGIGGYHDILGVIAMTKSGIELIEKEDNDLLVWLGEWEQENFNQAGASRLLGRVRLRKTLQK